MFSAARHTTCVARPPCSKSTPSVEWASLRAVWEGQQLCLVFIMQEHVKFKRHMPHDC